MGSIKNKVDRIVNRHGTSDPFELSKLKGIIIRYVELGSVLGFHTRHFRTSIIHINNSISREKQTFTCAHELGHAILHPNENTSFLKSKTLYSTDKLETEANTFAIHLLSKQTYNITVHEATEQYGVSEQLLMKNFYN